MCRPSEHRVRSWQVWICVNSTPPPPPSPHLVLLHCGPPAKRRIDLIQLKLQARNAIGCLQHSNTTG